MKNKTLFFLSIITTILGIYGCNQKTGEKQNQKQDQELSFILEKWSHSFCQKIDSNYNAIVNFKSKNNSSKYHIIINNKNYIVSEGLNDSAHFTFKSTIKHYNKIYRNEITGFTSMARAKMSDSTPLDIEFHKPISQNIMNDLLFFTQRYFNTSPHDKVILKKEKSRVVHGSHAIPLFYQMTNKIGVRSAWYLIEKGDQINDRGDSNPFPQYFIITKGEGFAKIGNDTIKIKENEAFYVAPGMEHIFWNESEDPIELLFLAWGEGA